MQILPKFMLFQHIIFQFKPLVTTCWWLTPLDKNIDSHASWKQVPTYSGFVFYERTQVTISHEWQDNHWFFLVPKAKTKKAQDMWMIEILHNDALLNKVFHSFLVQISTYTYTTCIWNEQSFEDVHKSIITIVTAVTFQRLS